MKATFAEEKAKFESEKKSEEWGRECLRRKLQTAEDLLSKECTDWKKICEKDNQRMYVARSKITDLEAQVADLKGKVEEGQADKERVEGEFKAHVLNTDKDLAAKDVEIAELKHRLHEQTDKNESLEIDLEAERVKAATTKRQEMLAPLLLTLLRSIMPKLKRSWIRWFLTLSGCAIEIANTILNASELDAAVAALIDASRAVVHHGGYLECAQHVEEAFGQEFDISNCSVTDQADAALARAEGVYDNLSLPVMDLVAEVLKHDDWCQRLKTILDPPHTVELYNEEETAGDDGDGDGNDGGDDGDGYEEMIVLIGFVPCNFSF
ncbi:hypothetical protein Hdeb2414_s0004g00140661 [Helianthus debilis subsp. tardiflorus]